MAERSGKTWADVAHEIWSDVSSFTGVLIVVMLFASTECNGCSCSWKSKSTPAEGVP